MAAQAKICCGQILETVNFSQTHIVGFVFVSGDIEGGHDYFLILMRRNIA
jgi:hypothetical protein